MWRARWVDDLSSRLGRFRRVVVWGHPWGSHTHSYVHAGFVRALQALGVETVWTDDPPLLDRLGSAQTLFITEGQVVGQLPRDRSCRYVLHNVEREWYQDLVGQVLLLQTHTLDVCREEAERASGERLNGYTYAAADDDGTVVLYQPWATDLLPDEFDFSLAPPPLGPGAYAAWVGTIGRGEFGNEDELAGFRTAAADAGVDFVHRQGVTLATHRALVAGSVVAPAIVGSWQLRKGYLPCRIFKNVSYGRVGLTNSPVVSSIFEQEVPWRADTAELLSLGVELLSHRELLVQQMGEVQARHTFYNRLETILSYLP
jgi:hypothetical protein